MRPRFAFDTSALVSLGHTDLIEIILENLDIVVTSTVMDELTEIGGGDDEDGRSARTWLDRQDLLQIRAVEGGSRGESAEDDLFLPCKLEHMPMVIDDIRAMKRFDYEVQCFFSVHMVYFLVKNDRITPQRGMVSIERMRRSRDWKHNLIYTIGRSLFE